jgi:hypothetical protein
MTIAAGRVSELLPERWFPEEEWDRESHEHTGHDRPSGTADWYSSPPFVDFTALQASVVLLAEVQPDVAFHSLRDRFWQLADQWSTDTAALSNTSKAVMHPSYQQIIGMGAAVLPLILESLRDRPDHWFWALTAIVGRDVAKGTQTFQEAASAWLDWGARSGLLR